MGFLNGFFTSYNPACLCVPLLPLKYCAVLKIVAELSSDRSHLHISLFWPLPGSLLVFYEHSSKRTSSTWDYENKGCEWPLFNLYHSLHMLFFSCSAYKSDHGLWICDSLVAWVTHTSTRPEVSEGGPVITNLIQGVAREETDIHRQIEVSMDLPLWPSWFSLEDFRGVTILKIQLH